jgi:hypothetical protein
VPDATPPVPELKGRLAILGSEGDQFFSVGQGLCEACCTRRGDGMLAFPACSHFREHPGRGSNGRPPHLFLANQSLIQPWRRGKRADRAMQPLRANKKAAEAGGLSRREISPLTPRPAFAADRARRTCGYRRPDGPRSQARCARSRRCARRAAGSAPPRSGNPTA